MMKKTFFTVVFALLWAIAPLVAQKNASISLDEVLLVRELARYEVHYGPILLGTVRIEPLRDTTYKGRPAWLAKAVIKSNPELWFVGDREEHFYGLMVRNDTMVYEVEYWKDDIDSKKQKEEHYILDYELGRATLKEKGKVVAVLPLTSPTICGMAFFYQARLYAGQNKTVQIPMLVGRISKPIVVNHTSQRSLQPSTAFGISNQAPVHFVTGRADIPGPFGFNGNFKGYMSDSRRRFPMDCFISVWVGSVHLKPVEMKVLAL